MINAFKWIGSPIGLLKLVASEAGLAAIAWENDRRSWKHLSGPMIERPDHPVLRRTECQLVEYFAGQRQAFSVALDLRGTPFQEAVWRALLAIPYGQSRSYGQIAREIGRPAAVRAVGAAIGMNPVAVVTPCHRVLGTAGTLTGFAGGLCAKRRLLDVEGICHRLSQHDGPADVLADVAPGRPGIAAA